MQGQLTQIDVVAALIAVLGFVASYWLRPISNAALNMARSECILFVAAAFPGIAGIFMLVFALPRRGREFEGFPPEALPLLAIASVLLAVLNAVRRKRS